MRSQSAIGRLVAVLVTAGLLSTAVVATAGPAQAAPTISFTPATQTISSGQTAQATYVGPSTQTLEYFIDGSQAGTSAAGDVITASAVPGDIQIPWEWFGSTTDHTLTIRVYSSTYDPFGVDPAYGDPYAASTDIVFSGTNPHPVVTAPTFQPMTKGSAFSQDIDFAALTSDFDFSGGGTVSVTGLPAGLQADLSNPSAPGSQWTASAAPIVHISGTPTTVGSSDVTFTVTDSNNTTASATATAVVSASLTLSAPAIGVLQVGIAYNQTFNMASNSGGFDWTNGGSVAITGLPAGLSSELTNESSGDPTVSVAGQAPRLAIFGTPTSAGSGSATLTLSDEVGDTRDVSVPWVVAPVSTASAAPTHIAQNQSSSVTWATARPITKVVAFFAGSPVAQYVVPTNGTSASVSWNDFAGVGDTFGSRDLELRLYNNTQWRTGQPNPTSGTAFDVATSLTLDAQPISLSPATANLSRGQTTTITYVGPDTRAYAEFVDGTLASYGTVSDRFTPSTTQIDVAWSDFGDSSARTVDFRVYNVDGAALAGPPAFSDAAVSQTEISFTAYVSQGAFTAPTLPVAYSGVPYDQTFNVADTATGFDWTNGGGVLVDNLPAGLSFELVNPNFPGSGFSVAGEAPVVRIFGTPTSTGTFSPTYSVSDDLGNYSVTSGSLEVDAVSLAFTPGKIGVGQTSAYSYSGPSDLQACLYLPAFSDQSFGCTTTANLTGTIAYEDMVAFFGGPLPTPVDFTIRVYGTPAGATPYTITDPYVAEGTLVFKATPQITTPSIDLLQAAAPFDQSIDAASFTSGFDWSAGGTITASGLPAGLTYSIANAVSGTSSSADDVSPIIEISGTPTTAGPVTFTLTVTDNTGGTQSVDVTVNVNVASTASFTPTNIGPDGTSTFSYTTVRNATLAVGYINGDIAFATPLSATSGDLPVDWNTFAMYGDQYAARNLVVRVYNDTQWNSGDLTPAIGATYDVGATLALDAKPASLTTTTPTITHLQAASFDYAGEPGNLACVFVDGVLAPSSCGSVESLTSPNTIPWSAYGGTTDRTITVRVFPQPATSSTVGIDWQTPYAATADVVFGYYIVPAITAPTLSKIQAGVAVNQSFDLGPLSVGFFWTGGGTVDITGLPDGLSYAITNPNPSDPTRSADGQAPVISITGTPTTAGDSTFSITATDQMANTASIDVPVTVLPAATLSTLPLNPLQAGVPFDQSFDINSFATNFDWSTGSTVDITNLPAGLDYSVSTLTAQSHHSGTVSGSPTVRIFGTPTTPGEFTFTVTVTDGFGASASVDVSGTVADAATVSAPEISPMRVGRPALQTIKFDTLTTGFDWTNGGSVAVAGLPDGVSYVLSNPSDTDPSVSQPGQAPEIAFSGTPTTDGAFTLSMTVSDPRGATATVDAPVTVLLATVLPIPTIGALQVGVPFDQTITVPADAAGWNWHMGGTSTVTGLPDGLTYSISNDSGNGWTGNGEIPLVHLTGTPTVAGSGSFTWTVTDADGGTATLDVPYSVAAGIAATDPEAQTIAAPGAVHFTIPGVGEGADVVAGPLSAGVDSIVIDGANVTLNVNARFSGVISQPITSTYYGVSTTVHLNVTVLVVAPGSPTFQPSKGQTIVRWTPSANAFGYLVTLPGAKSCLSWITPTACVFSGVYGPKAAFKVVALGGNRLHTTASATYVRPTTPIDLGAVSFAVDSAKLSPAAKTALRNYAKFIAAQGFTRLVITGYAAHQPGSTSAADKKHRLALAAARAAATRTEIVAQLHRLGVTVSVRTVSPGTVHNLSGSAAAIAAVSRRAVVSVS